MASDFENNTMRGRFDSKVRELIEKKRGDNNFIFTRERYETILAAVKKSKAKSKNKEPKDYRMQQRFDVLVNGDCEKLIKPTYEPGENVVYYIATDELFDVIHSTHLDINHGGRNKMTQELKNQYCNVTQEVITIYLSLCRKCQKKKTNFQAKKEFVSKPKLSRNLGSRGHIDFIDMQLRRCDDLHYVMVYEDQLTKFVVLRALATKKPEEVASHLLDIFTTFGAPVILQSSEGREFSCKVIEELCLAWKGVRLVNGNPTVPVTSGRDVENMLSKWLNDNDTADWPHGLKFVQFAKNCARNDVLKRSPYEAMFKSKIRFGLASLSLPVNVAAAVETEEDLDEIRGTLSAPSASNNVQVFPELQEWQ